MSKENTIILQEQVSPSKTPVHWQLWEWFHMHIATSTDPFSHLYRLVTSSEFELDSSLPWWTVHSLTGSMDGQKRHWFQLPTDFCQGYQIWLKMWLRKLHCIWLMLIKWLLMQAEGNGQFFILKLHMLGTSKVTHRWRFSLPTYHVHMQVMLH